MVAARAVRVLFRAEHFEAMLTLLATAAVWSNDQLRVVITVVDLPVGGRLRAWLVVRRPNRLNGHLRRG